MAEPTIIPQHLFGKKWRSCLPHQAQRWAICLGIKIIQTYPSRSEAEKHLGYHTRTTMKPKSLKLNSRYPTSNWRGTYASSLSQDQYLTLHPKR